MLFRMMLLAATLCGPPTSLAADGPMPRIPFLPGETPTVRPAAEPDRETGTEEEYSVRVLLSAPRAARISSQMRGRVEEIAVDMGDSFNEGDLLVRFACDHQMADQSSDRARLEKARKTLAAQEQLQHLDAVSSLDVELAKVDVKVARAEVEKSEATVSDCRILAPYEGRVVRVNANEYEIVDPGVDLLQIVESGTLKLEALIPSSWLVWLKKGDTFKVIVDELGLAVDAHVTALGSRVDPVSQTIAIQAEIHGNPPDLLPGMSGDARFKGPEDHGE